MRKISILLIAAVLCMANYVHAQHKLSAVFTPAGNAFYNYEKGEITLTSLPDMKSTVVVTQAALTPHGNIKPLRIKNIQLSEKGNFLLLFTNTKRVWRYETMGEYFVYDVRNGSLKKLGKSLPDSSLMFAKISPDEQHAAYVSGHNIYVESLVTGAIQRLTTDGNSKIINGTFDWAYEEEFGCRDGFRWSPDSRNIAFWQLDASNIKDFLMINNTDSIYSFTIPVQYPVVGEDPSACRIGFVNIESKQIVWMKTGADSKQNYLPRMEWIPNGNRIIVQMLNRKQNESSILISDAETGNSKLLFHERDSAWIDIKSRWNDDDPRGWEWVNDKNDFVWISEKEGWRQAYLISMQGNVKKLTTEEFDIIKLEGIDSKNQFIYFTASPSNATESYLYRQSLKKNGKPERLTPAAFQGTNSYTFSPNGIYAQHSFSNVVTPPAKAWILAANHSFLTPAPHVNKNDRAVEFFTITTVDGVDLDGYMIKPENFDSTKKYPAVFYVYGEPGATTVNNAYGAVGNFLYNGDIRKDGYIQISMDNRGTPAPKGAAWRKSIYRKIGRINIRDQAMGAKKLLDSFNYIDSSRMAVWGWSGGGSSTLNLLFQYPEIFQTGISISPVTNMLTYDNIYEERYMGVPWESKADYIAGSPLTYVANLRGNLLLIHGTGDDNVHYQNTELLINELIQHNKIFRFMSYPNRSHSLSEGGYKTAQHLSTIYTDFLKANCKPGAK